MNIKFQSSTIPFKEFAEQHPDDSILVPDSHGVDGTVLFQILIPFVLEVVKDIIGYIAKQSIENKEAEKAKANSVVVVLKDGYCIQFPISAFGDKESVFRRIEDEVRKIDN